MGPLWLLPVMRPASNGICSVQEARHDGVAETYLL